MLLLTFYVFQELEGATTLRYRSTMNLHSPVHRQALGSTQASGTNVLLTVNELFSMTGCIDHPRARVIHAPYILSHPSE